MRTAILVAVLTLAPGCFWVFDDKGDDACDLPLAEVADPAPLRNPETLLCETFGTGCDPSCGPCPLTDLSQPFPSWGTCGNACEQLSEGACAADPSCRVVKDAKCAVGRLCETDFVGCFPTDQGTDPTLSCFAADDGSTCSRSNGCVAFHRSDCSAGERSEQCPRSFALCAPEGADVGRCHEQATCDRVAPACGTNETAGVANGCYTGACIPNDVCEPV